MKYANIYLIFGGLQWFFCLQTWSWERLKLTFLTIGISHCILKLLFSITDGEEKTYGGCEGPDAMYVKLISSDGHEFIVKREHALTSGTIKAMLSGPGKYNRCKTFMSFSFSVGVFAFLLYSEQKLEQIITCSNHY